MNRYRDDDDGQFDGDAGASVGGFAAALGDQPWLRSQLPPWHMWGNRELITLNSGSFGTASAVTNQLTAVRYARPETWHWFFCARLLSVEPAPIVPQSVDLLLDFELIVGLGRSSTQLREVGPALPFERYRWQWQPPAASRVGVQIWSNTVVAPNRDQTAGATPIANVVTEIVGQDIQLNATLRPGPNNNYVYVAQVEVEAYWAPKTHVRPDWFQDARAPKEARFPGAEVPGR
jgi:hypothetical protein